MPTTGEECWHQKVRRIYLDSGFDVNFDSQVEHYCMLFGEEVVPARRCGSICPAFQPMTKADSPDHAGKYEADGPKALKARTEAVRQLLKVTCDDITQTVQYLEEQFPKREQRWHEENEWLSQHNITRESLNQSVAEAKRDVQRKRAAFDEDRRQLRRLKASDSDRFDLGDIERLWIALEGDNLAIQDSVNKVHAIQDLPSERARRKAERDNSKRKWEDANERIPLLKRLQAVVASYVEGLLADSSQPLTEQNAERILRDLRDVRTVATDDVPCSDLRQTIEKFT